MVMKTLPSSDPERLRPAQRPCTGNLAASDWNTAVELDAAVKLNVEDLRRER